MVQRVVVVPELDFLNEGEFLEFGVTEETVLGLAALVEIELRFSEVFVVRRACEGAFDSRESEASQLALPLDRGVARLGVLADLILAVAEEGRAEAVFFEILDVFFMGDEEEVAEGVGSKLFFDLLLFLFADEDALESHGLGRDHRIAFTEVFSLDGGDDNIFVEFFGVGVDGETGVFRGTDGLAELALLDVLGNLMGVLFGAVPAAFGASEPDRGAGA